MFTEERFVLIWSVFYHSTLDATMPNLVFHLQISKTNDDFSVGPVVESTPAVELSISPIIALAVIVALAVLLLLSLIVLVVVSCCCLSALKKSQKRKFTPGKCYNRYNFKHFTSVTLM